ncbi:NAD(P)H-quinone oxidoreductase subunit S, chloroplastic [Tanacetum coccineum]
MAVASFNLSSLHLHKSQFLGHTHKLSPSLPTPKQTSHKIIIPCAKFDLFEILGGRGLLGEKRLQEFLKKPPQETPTPTPAPTTTTNDEENVVTLNVPETGFDKELLGLTGGFPGGEKGLKDFIEKNPPPKRTPPPSSSTTNATFDQTISRKPKSTRITITNARNDSHSGNWDRLITFKLNELERREKGPPMVSPRSVVLEELREKSS